MRCARSNAADRNRVILPLQSRETGSSRPDNSFGRGEKVPGFTVEAVHFPSEKDLSPMLPKGADGYGFSPSPSQNGTVEGPLRATSDAGQLITKMRRWWRYAVFSGTFQLGKGRSLKNIGVAIPQRHRIAGFAAVVEGGRRCNTHHRAYNKGATEIPVPQWQENTGNAAVVA